MLQRLGIRGKLLAVVLVPVFVLLLAATYITWESATTYRDAANAQNIVTAIQSAQVANEALQVERDAGANFVSAVQDTGRRLRDARALTDGRYADLVELADAGVPGALQALAEVDDSVGKGAGKPLLDGPRSLGMLPAGEDGWIGFPDGEAILSMSIDYAQISDELLQLAEGQPAGSEVRVALLALNVQIGLEGDLATTSFTAPVPYMEEFRANEQDVDVALAALAEAVANVESSDVNALAIEYFNVGLVIREDLATMRAQVAGGTGGDQTVSTYYATPIRALQEAAEAAATVFPDPDAAVELRAYAAADRLIERIRFESVATEAIIRRGTYLPSEADAFKTIGTTTDLALAEAQSRAAQVGTLPGVPAFGASVGGEGVALVSFSSIRAGVQSGRDNQLIDARNQDWVGQVEEELAPFEAIRAEAWDHVRDATNASEQAAAVQVVVTLATVIGGIVASILVALVISRRITNPLRRLTTTATAVRQELPRLVERVALPGQTVDVSEVQIPVESTDEVGRLAEAFNSINAATLAIAAEQAALRGSISEMFINVARRDQVLLNRQLASIDEMERTQDDPDTLTKLFALDHLATRMRRNSESLLVLAGIDTGRRLRRAMPLSDVVRTASSEIELYERVQLELDADPAMLGHSALTAAHLFAELLENATVFSDPGTPVIVRTMANAGGFEVTISDSGIGMTVEELGEANARVASTAASEILGAQRLGLFVVGRIARRVGARVHIDSIEGKGTVATIVMPPTLFESDSDPTVGHVSASVIDSALHAPAALVEREDDLELPPIPVSMLDETPLPVARASSMVVDVADEDMPVSTGMERLVARDAAEAPMAEAVDLDELTEGVTGAGLPTRRRRDAKGPEAAKDTSSIIALPQRASDEQLSALSTAATSGFTPILAADEISPESAEQRSRVFRGFRPLREAESEGADVPPDAESLGQAVRRKAFVAEPGPSAGVPSEAIPTLEPEPRASQAHAGLAESILAEPFREPPVLEPAFLEPPVLEPAVLERAPSASSPFVVEAADPREEIDAVVGQDPRIGKGFDPTQNSGETTPVSRPAGPFAVPALEDDRFVEDEPRVLTPWGRAARAAAMQEPAQPAGVDASVTAQAPAQAPAGAAPAQEPEAAAAPAVQAPTVQRSALYPAASAVWQSQPAVPQPQPTFAQDAVTSSPSLDQLILDGALDSGAEKGGFFGKLFGRGRKDDVEHDAGPPATPAVPIHYEVAEQYPVSDPVPHYMSPMSGEFAVATGEHNVAPYAEAAPYTDPAGYNSAYAPAPTPSFDEAVLSGPIPTPALAPSSPWSQAIPAVAEAFTPDYSAAPAAPQWSQNGAYATPADAPRAPALFDSSTGTFYSPDQLARPLGWETAGATALQAAAPEAEFGYHPVVEIAPEEPAYVDEGDVASAVFSELSSLAAERPKVNKTRAGLVKREPVEVVPQAVEVPAQQAAPRDPDAVRSRFNAFYTGTQRARSDVREFNESTQTSLTER